ncbi:phosphocarrier protein HPr [Gammaproteobacteria bacterium]
MQKMQLMVINPYGLHARPASALVKLAARFESEVILIHGKRRAKVKDIFDVLTLDAPKGSILQLITHGKDEELAIESIAALIQDGFGEMGPPAKT